MSTLTADRHPARRRQPGPAPAPHRRRRPRPLHLVGRPPHPHRQQKEEAGDAYGADARFLTAGKKLLDTRHEAFRQLTVLRTRIVNYWRGLTLPYVEPGVRLIRQADVEAFVHTMEGFQEELTAGRGRTQRRLRADQGRRPRAGWAGSTTPPTTRPRCGACSPSSGTSRRVEPPSYLMRICPEVYRQEQERVARRFEEAVRLAEQAFAGEFGKLVSHLTERLAGGEDGQRRVFRDSAVTNLGEFFERFRDLNVAQQPGPGPAGGAGPASWCEGSTPQDLRDDAGLRAARRRGDGAGAGAAGRPDRGPAAAADRPRPTRRATEAAMQLVIDPSGSVRVPLRRGHRPGGAGRRSPSARASHVEPDEAGAGGPTCRRSGPHAGAVRPAQRGPRRRASLAGAAPARPVPLSASA